MFVEHKEALEITEAPAKTLKLSEAIRIGAAKRPKAVGKYFQHGASCALGAAYEAVTGEYKEVGQPNMIKWFEDHFGMGDVLGMMITEKNDSGMSRESIADWLEKQGR